jgi:UDP-N-acetylmuramoyl-tripeptide--D-alanyl-D-alanine ligase
MRYLHDSLPAARRGVWTESAELLAQQVSELVSPGDVVMIKGSNGSKMRRVVDAIKALEIEHETT